MFNPEVSKAEFPSTVSMHFNRDAVTEFAKKKLIGKCNDYRMTNFQ